MHGSRLGPYMLLHIVKSKDERLRLPVSGEQTGPSDITAATHCEK